METSGLTDRRNDELARKLAAEILSRPVQFGYVGEKITESGRRAIATATAGKHPTETYARLLARAALCNVALGTEQTSTVRDTAEHAMALAFDGTDTIAQAELLLAFATTDLGPDSLDERIAMARRVVSIAQENGEIELGALGSFVLIGSLVESGDMAAVDAELATRLMDSADERADQRHIAWFRAMRALLDGRVEVAETRCIEAMELARAENDDDADSVYFGQLGIVRWLQGREVEVESLYLSARELQPEAPVWSAVLARLWALDGRRELAAATLDKMADFSGIPRDRNWLLSLCVLAETAVLLDNSSAAEVLRMELLPYSDRLVPIGLGIACFGSVARPLGLLARALGRTEEAEHHFRAAISLTAAVGARPWLAQAQFDLAQLLREQGVVDSQLESEAAATAHATDTAHLIPAGLQPVLAAPHRSRPLVGPTVRVLGTFEVIDVDGKRAMWTSRKARDLLKVLIAKRCTAVSRSTLVGQLWPDEHPADASNRLSVALSTVRRSIDPNHREHNNYFVGSDGESIWINTDVLAIDVMQLLGDAETTLRERPTDRDLLNKVVSRYRGPAFADELDAEWAHDLRLAAAATFLGAARRLASLALEDDPLLATETYRKILAEDPYDEVGHQGLVEALRRLGAHGRSEHARQLYYARMAELGIDVESLRGTEQ
jgi:DNA-binding SARP family transcriptional activator